MKNKIIVWDLFGGGQNSVYNSINENEKIRDLFEVYTWDVTEPTREHHYKLDLSSDDIVELFKGYPKPDIIVASPLCQSFSCVLSMKGGGTPFWKLNENKDLVIERSVEEFEQLKNGFTKNLKADVQLFIKRLGQKCLDNTIELIKYYKPKLFYIENPKNSMMWKYIKLNRKDFFDENNHFLNEASYGKYGFLTTKATYFYSNLRLELKKGRIEPPYYVKEIDGEKYYVLKDDESVKLKRDLDSRMIGLASISKIIKARKVKSGMGAMDFIQRSKTPVQKNKMVNEQICEAGPASAIPHDLVNDIFEQFYAVMKS
ncbi:C5 methylase (MAV1virus-like) protein [Mycoplasma sp. HU2014]|uniref:C5 methylase (MAV1virus-like) protein n=1 Tax=Mycoplasma sp. HU2014 TaxID=1664275 RepID=UPI00067C4CFF|nr:C5 methylase (MAV1virus-like) protein [Mycoplasma sp. HU2014]KNG79510.1 DNA methyltransferase [Mycoplasma sp. HU2014]